MKKILKAVGLILAFLVIYYLLQGIATFIFAIIYAIKTGVVAGLSGRMPDIYAMMTDMMGFISAQTPWIIIFAAVASLPLYYLFYLKRRQELRTFVSVRRLNVLSVLVLVIFALSVNILIELLLSLASQLQVFSDVFEQYNAVSNLFTSGGFVMSLIGVGIVGPIFEEILFRGLIFGELRKITRIRLAIVIQAVLFGVYHMNLVQGSYALIIGLLLGFVYYRTNSIIAPMIVHIVINSSSVLMSYLITDTQYEKFGGAIAIAGVALFFLTGAFLLISKNFKRGMDNSLYEQNRLPQSPEQGGGPGPML